MKRRIQIIVFLLFAVTLMSTYNASAGEPEWKTNAKWSKRDAGSHEWKCLSDIPASFQKNNVLVAEAIRLAKEAQREPDKDRRNQLEASAFSNMLVTQCHNADAQQTFIDHREDLIHWLQQGGPD